MNKPDKQGDFASRAGLAMTAAAWILFLMIFAGLFDYLFNQRYNPNQNIVTRQYEQAEGLQKEIKLQRNVYGHYVSNGTINGQAVVFLLDTGASDVAIPEAVANRIGLVKGPAIMIKTANGNTRAYRTRLDSVAIGDIRLYDVRATVLQTISGEEVLLGMSFLKHFEIIQKGTTLTIRQ